METESDNFFLTQLHSTYKDVLDHAIAQNCIVCVPMAASIVDKNISRRFIRTSHAVDHMLKPSPYVPHLFQSLSNKNLIIKQDEIKSHTGYSHTFTVMIVKEENSHDSRGKVYKQITISAPLDDTADKYTLIPPDPIYQFSSAEEYNNFMRHAVEGSEAAVMYAVAFVEFFNVSYTPYRTYSRDCYDKVKTALRDLQTVTPTQICLKIPQFANLKSNIRLFSYLTNLVESLLLPSIYDKLFLKMVEFNEEDEVRFQHDCDLLRNGSAECFGLEADIENCKFTEAHEVLKSVNEVKTPWEKLNVITRLSTVIDSEIKRHLAEINAEKAEKWAMSADQYFPILTKFIALQRVPCLIANLTYITEFSLCPMSSSEQKYHFINLLATVQSIEKHAQEIAQGPVGVVPAPPVQKRGRSEQAISLSDSEDA